MLNMTPVLLLKGRYNSADRPWERLSAGDEDARNPG